MSTANLAVHTLQQQPVAVQASAVVLLTRGIHRHRSPCLYTPVAHIGTSCPLVAHCLPWHEACAAAVRQHCTLLLQPQQGMYTNLTLDMSAHTTSAMSETSPQR
jgi:hypothetical protein